MRKLAILALLAALVAGGATAAAARNDYYGSHDQPSHYQRMSHDGHYYGDRDYYDGRHHAQYVRDPGSPDIPAQPRPNQSQGGQQGGANGAYQR